MQPGPRTAPVPVEVIRYTADDRRRFERLWRTWLASPRTDRSLWEQYEGLVSSGRFNFHERENPGQRFYFGEAFVARQLEDEGYQCWGTCRLFGLASQKAPYLEQTQAVRDLILAAGRPLPANCVARLDFTPRNPDITAWHKTRGFRFVEVKTNTSGNRLDQQQSLAVLRELLDAEVSVVRLVLETSTVKHRALLPAGFTVR
jgi:hypothetical protein